MKILITGANGYIGSKLVRKLCDKNIDVIATDFDSSHIDCRARFVPANIFERNDDWYSFFDKPDICVHMAWRDGFMHNSDKHMEDLSSHFSFMKNLIDNGLPKIVSIGSMHEIGYWEGMIDENTPCKPLSQYGVAKNALRQSMELYCKQKGCKFQWLRCFYIFGDDDYGNSVFCKIRQAVKEGKESFPFTSGINRYDFIHIDELTEQLSLCIMQDEVLGIINCCSGKPVSLAEQVERYIATNKLPIRLDYGKFPDREYDSPCIYGNNSKINAIKRKTKALKVLVTGVAGQLGYDLVNELSGRGHTVFGTDIKDESELINIGAWESYVQLDITNENSTMQVVRKISPDVVIHCAAWTAVDKAEKFPELVMDINANGTKYLAKASCCCGASMVYVSTDYVFNGKGEKPWRTNDKKDGLSVYGRSKSLGEDFLMALNPKYFIVRTTGVFGLNGNNFIKTMLKIADSGKTEINVVNDQIVSVTYTKDLAKFLADIIATDKYGVYHAANLGYFSWADFAKEIFREANIKMVVNGISTEDYMKLIPNQTKRPKNSRLSLDDTKKAGFSLLPDHLDALRRYLKEIKRI